MSVGDKFPKRATFDTMYSIKKLELNILRAAAMFDARNIRPTRPNTTLCK